MDSLKFTHVIWGLAMAFAAAAGNPGSALAQEQSPARTCVVQEVLDGGGYSYVRCRESATELWLGTMVVKLKPGELISFPDGPPLANYRSKSLGRDFPQIIMVSNLTRLTGKADAGAALRAEPVPVAYQEVEAALKNSQPAPELSAEESLLQETFFQALAEGNLHEISQCLARGVKVESTDAEGRTPLMLASQHGYLAVVETLLKHRAQVNARDINGAVPLMFAAKGGHDEIVKFLLANHAKV